MTSGNLVLVKVLREFEQRIILLHFTPQIRFQNLMAEVLNVQDS